MSNRRYTKFISAAVLILAALLFNSCAEKFELSISGVTGGQVAMNPTDGAYSEGTRITLTALSESGYSFTGWGNIGEYSTDYSVDNPIEIVMPSKSIQITAGFSVPSAGWTFMIYMSGDNSLSNQVPLDINEIEKGLYDAVNSGNNVLHNDLRVLILADQSGSADTRLYYASPDNTNSIVSPVISAEFNSKGELDLSDPETLENFITYGLAYYPSQYNALVLWNHGGGVKNLEIQPLLSKGICEDDGELMYLNEVQTAIKAALGTKKLDIIGMDACIMGEVETAYEMQTVADYFVASAANELGYGWGYTDIFDKFTSAGSPPASAEMVDILVTQYKESTPSLLHYEPDTMVAVKTSELGALKTQIDELAKLIYIDYQGDSNLKTVFESCRDASVYYYAYDSELETRYVPYYDIYSFCTQIELSADFSAGVKSQASSVKTALAAAVVANFADSSIFDDNNPSWPDLNLDYYSTTDAAAVRGLSIMIPHGEEFKDSKSYYYDIWWYGAGNYQTNYPDITLGGIDFCTYDSDGTVETWRELFEAWYDDYPDINNSSGTGMGYTPGKH